MPFKLNDRVVLKTDFHRVGANFGIAIGTQGTVKDISVNGHIPYVLFDDHARRIFPIPVDDLAPATQD